MRTRSVASQPCKIVLGNLMRPPSKKSFCHQGFFAVKRRAVFILGAKWKALVEGGGGIVWLAAWKLVSNDAKRTVAPPNAKPSTLLQGCFFMFLFLIPPTIRQQFNTCLACFNDLLVVMLRFGVGIIALCCYLYAFGICCFGIISDPLRGSTQGWGIVTKLRSFAPAELHSLAWCFA